MTFMKLSNNNLFLIANFFVFTCSYASIFAMQSDTHNHFTRSYDHRVSSVLTSNILVIAKDYFKPEKLIERKKNRTSLSEEQLSFYEELDPFLSNLPKTLDELLAKSDPCFFNTPGYHELKLALRYDLEQFATDLGYTGILHKASTALKISTPSEIDRLKKKLKEDLTAIKRSLSDESFSTDTFQHLAEGSLYAPLSPQKSNKDERTKESTKRSELLKQKNNYLELLIELHKTQEESITEYEDTSLDLTLIKAYIKRLTKRALGKFDENQYRDDFSNLREVAPTPVREDTIKKIKELLLLSSKKRRVSAIKTPTKIKLFESASGYDHVAVNIRSKLVELDSALYVQKVLKKDVDYLGLHITLMFDKKKQEELCKKIKNQPFLKPASKGLYLYLEQEFDIISRETAFEVKCSSSKPESHLEELQRQRFILENIENADETISSLASFPTISARAVALLVQYTRKHLPEQEQEITTEEKKVIDQDFEVIRRASHGISSKGGSFFIASRKRETPSSIEDRETPKKPAPTPISGIKNLSIGSSDLLKTVSKRQTVLEVLYQNNQELAATSSPKPKSKTSRYQ